MRGFGQNSMGLAFLARSNHSSYEGHHCDAEYLDSVLPCQQGRQSVVFYHKNIRAFVAHKKIKNHPLSYSLDFITFAIFFKIYRQ